MPTYEYICDNCRHQFEQLQPITSKPLRKCPQCGKLKLVRLIGSGAGIIFKGSGFYQTDYRTENYNKGSKSDAPPAPAAKKDEAKKETPKSETPAPSPEKKDSGGKKDSGKKES
jgi:putative FmdB family regulatory protein